MRVNLIARLVQQIHAYFMRITIHPLDTLFDYFKDCLQGEKCNYQQSSSRYQNSRKIEVTPFYGTQSICNHFKENESY